MMTVFVVAFHVSEWSTKYF